MKKENVVTAEAIRADPYGFTYKEYAAALGEEEAKRSFAALYGRKRDKSLATLSVRTVYRGTDTDKYLFELPDGKLIETVCIKRRDGATVCVSTQVGCPLGCVFCESGRNGFVRNLAPSEIVQQVILIPRRVTRIVFMGMGEPLFNYDNVIQAIHILRDRNGLDSPTDGITISTTGPLDRLKRLREEHLKINSPCRFTLQRKRCGTASSPEPRIIRLKMLSARCFPIRSGTTARSSLHICSCRGSMTDLPISETLRGGSARKT